MEPEQKKIPTGKRPGLGTPSPVSGKKQKNNWKVTWDQKKNIWKGKDPKDVRNYWSVALPIYWAKYLKGLQTSELFGIYKREK